MTENLRFRLEQYATVHERLQEMHPNMVGSLEGIVCRYLLVNGTEYAPIPFPTDLDRGEKRECYANATNLAMKMDWGYCEGYAMRPELGLPILHAWCVNENGEAVDPTWDDPESCEYIGIEFQTPWVLERILSQGTYGIICNDWMNQDDSLLLDWKQEMEMA